MRKTKIVCTLGPASDKAETIKEMLLAGMNVARINLSHGTRESRAEMINTFRKTRDELGIPAAVLLDTRGPEVRVGNFREEKVELKEGDFFTLTPDEIQGDEKRVSVTYKNLAEELAIGDTVLINDGRIVLKVSEIKGGDVTGKVLHGGVLSDHKGINIPAVDLEMEYLGEKDRDDIIFGIKNQVDYIAASFIRNQADIREVRDFTDENGGKDIKIIAKIESIHGIENFEDILEIADGIMVARGDMGVEVAYEKLPGIQKKIIRRCVQSGKIVITATEMLESMTASQVPTRAEITDVANAVFDGTSAVMLSGETAAGNYPVESVKAMARIAKQAENDYTAKGPVWHEMNRHDVTNAVGHAACTLAEDTESAAVMAVTKTGYAAGRMSKFRPETMIIGATPYTKTYHQMSLMWGVMPLQAEYKNKDNINDLFSYFAAEAVKEGMIKKGETVVITAGLPVDVAGNTNFIRVISTEDEI